MKKRKPLKWYPLRVYEIMAPDIDCLMEEILNICEDSCLPIIDIAAKQENIGPAPMVFARIVAMGKTYKDV